MQKPQVLGKYLKKLKEVTESRIEALRQARAFNHEEEFSEEELANQIRDYFIPLLKNIAKRCHELANQSARNTDSIDAMESAIEQLRREHLDLWKSFSALLGQYASRKHPDSAFLENLLHDYDLRRSYVETMITPKGSSSASVAGSKLIIKDFADRFEIFWRQMNEYVKENYTSQGKTLDSHSPFSALKKSKDFRDFYHVYKKYSEIKEASEAVNSGIKSMRYDFEDIVETAALLENQMVEKLGYYVMFYDEEEGDFHGLTKEIFKEFNVRIKSSVMHNMEKSTDDREFLNLIKAEFRLIWDKLVPKDLLMAMEQPPIEIAFYIMEQKARR